MGRAGRYTLSVMVFVAAFAAWTNVVGLVVAAVVQKPPSASVASGVTSLMYVVLSSVPTIAALWFNDWARDGFPSAQERRRGDYRRADRTLRDLVEAPRDLAEAPRDLAEAPAVPADGTEESAAQ